MPAYAVGSFSALFGGAGSEALAMLVTLGGLGVTFSNSEDAVTMFNDLKNNYPAMLASMVYMVSQSWVGHYDDISGQLRSMRDSVFNWLESIFGTVQSGANNLSKSYYYLDGYNFFVDPYFQKIDNDFYVRYNILVNDITRLSAYSHTVTSLPSFSSVTYTDVRRSGSDYYLSFSFYVNGLLKSFTQRVSVALVPPSSAYPSSNVSVNISSDAGVLDGEFDPDERDPIFLPPPYVPGLNLEKKINPSGGVSNHFDGDAEEYMKKAADNNTWSDVDSYIKTGAPSTSLTETGTGGLVVGDTNVDGLPYPDVGVSNPADVLTGLGGITGLLQGINNWIAQIINTLTNVFAIPTDLALNFEPLRLTDFKNKFPFCIPWDLYNSVALFASAPSEPDLDIVIDTDYIQVNHSINLGPINLPLRFARFAIIVFFVIFLITKTRDLIKW